MRPYTFPASCRIRTRAEYDRTFQNGRSVHTAHFRVVFAPGAEAWSRMGVITARRVGKAHRRNHVRRIVREWFRQRRREFSPPVDLVIIAKPGAASLTGAAAAEELDTVRFRWQNDSPQR